MQEEPIDFSLTSSKKRKQSSWHIPVKTQWLSPKQDQPTSSSQPPSAPLSSPSSQVSSQAVGDCNDDTRPCRPDCEREATLSSSVADQGREDRWSCSAAAGKISKDSSKTGRSRKTGIKKSSEHGSHDTGLQKSSAGQSEAASSVSSPGLTNARNLPSGFETPALKASNMNFTAPAGEYEQIESCETRGLKLTFRRRSTEKSLQQAQKEKTAKPAQDIPKLIVQKCKSADGYSLHNGKAEKQCKCTHSASTLKAKEETEILTLPISPKLMAASQPRFSVQVQDIDQACTVKALDIIKIKQVISPEKDAPKPEEQSIDDRSDSSTKRYAEAETDIASDNQDSVQIEGTDKEVRTAPSEKLTELDTSLNGSSAQSVLSYDTDQGVGLSIIISEAERLTQVPLSKEGRACIAESNAGHKSLDWCEDKQEKQPPEPEPGKKRSDCLKCGDSSGDSFCKCPTALFTAADTGSKNTPQNLPQNMPQDMPQNMPQNIQSFPADTNGTNQPGDGGNALYFLKRKKFLKSKSESEPSPPIIYWKRSESAPPPASSMSPTLGTSLSESDCTSFDMSSGMRLEDDGHEVSALQKQTHEQTPEACEPPARPKSSPPICTSHKPDENTSRKSPVVLLDRLPSPVIELYSMHNMIGYCRSSRFSSNDSSSGHSGHSGEQFSDNEASSSPCSDYDSEDHVTSSGKLKFTYRKVTQKKRTKFQGSRSSRLNFRPKDYPNDNFQHEDGDDGVIACKRKIKYINLQRRKHYGRASKRGVRYVIDDDEYADEKTEIRNDVRRISDLHRESYVSYKEEKAASQPRKSPDLPLLNGSLEFQKDGATDTADMTSNLVDPRIKSMSAALLHACQHNQSAEKIAFRRKTVSKACRRKDSLSRKPSTQLTKKTSRVVDKIRKHLSRTGNCINKQDDDKPLRKSRRGNIHEVRHELKPHEKHATHSKQQEAYLHSLPSSDLSSLKNQILLSEKRLQPNDNDISPSKYRNVFESDVFRLSTNVCSELWSPTSSDRQKRRRYQIKTSRSDKQSPVKRWAMRGSRRGKTMKRLPGEISYKAGRSMECCKCRCTCRSNARGLKGRRLHQKKANTKDSVTRFSQQGSYKESHLYNLDMCIKSECTDAESVSSQTSSVIKREMASPLPEETPDSTTVSGDVPEELPVPIQVKVEIAKDTDFMGLDYSLPGRLKQGSHDFEPGHERDDTDATREDRSVRIPESTEGTSSKPWNIPCMSSRGTGQDKLDPPFSASSKVPSPYATSAASKVISPASGSSLERSVNFSSASDTTATPLFLFTNQVASQAVAVAGYPVSHVSNCSSATAYLSALTLNMPLSIQIGHSPGNSEFDASPSLAEYSSPGYCSSQSLLNRKNSSQASNKPYQSISSRNNIRHSNTSHSNKNRKTPTTEAGIDLKSEKDFSKSDLQPPKLSMHIPKITVSSPSSMSSKGQVTPSTASPPGASHSCFISPSLPRQPHVKSLSRSSSPFRSPSNLLSPYKSPTRANVDWHHRSFYGASSRGCSETGNNRYRSSLGYSPNYSRNALGTHAPRAGNRYLHNSEDYESDDSDATLVYPRAEQERRKAHSKASVPSRRSSVGLSSTCYSEGSCASALNSPNSKSDERHPSMLSPTDSLDQKRSELSLMVSDLRENISKTKAMKRSRRTNSFSGENQSSITDVDSSSRAAAKRPPFERFKSVEPLMDSDTPYARLTQGFGCANEEDNKSFEMLRFVSELRLQPKPRDPKTTCVSPDSVAETQIYGLNYDQNLDYKKESRDTTEKVEDEVCGQSRKDVDGCSEVNGGAEVSAQNDSQTSNENKFAEDDSDGEERPLVVIENAESDEVIEGDEAFNKVSSGTYKLPTGAAKRSRARASKSSFNGKRLRISMKSLFTKKSPTKSNCFMKSSKKVRETLLKHGEKSKSQGCTSPLESGRNTSCRLHQKYANRKKKGRTVDSTEHSHAEECDCKKRNASGKT